MDYGEYGIDAVILRLSDATGPDDTLDVLVWLHAGMNYQEGDGWIRGAPTGPYEVCSSVSAFEAVRTGLAGVRSTFNVPDLTADLGAALGLAVRWFPDARIDIRTGGKAGWHRTELTLGRMDDHAGVSRANAATALMAALLTALRAEGRHNRFPAPEMKTPARITPPAA